MFQIWCYLVHNLGNSQKTTIGEFTPKFSGTPSGKAMGHIWKMGQTSLCARSLVEIGGRMATRDEKQRWFLFVCM